MCREAKQVQLLEIPEDEIEHTEEVILDETIPEENEYTEEEAIPAENGHTEGELILEESIPVENEHTEEETISESARSSLPGLQELHFVPKCRKRGRPKGACATADVHHFTLLVMQSKQKLVLHWFVNDSVVREEPLYRRGGD